MGEEHEERAAIAEEGAKAPRVWAEALARLNPDLAPGDVPQRRWQLFINDCGRFLDEGWSERAAALGWTPLDLFGCDREHPFARLEHAGLLWLLNGGKIAALSTDTARIRSPSGTPLTYHRRPVEPGRVVFAWGLARPGAKLSAKASS